MSETSAARDALQPRMMELTPGTARCADRANTGKITETEEGLKCPKEMDPWQCRSRFKHCRLPRRLRQRVERSTSSASWTYQCPESRCSPATR